LQAAAAICSSSSAQHAPQLSPRSTHALELYRECVVAGQWARLTLEQRPGGEYITLRSSPPAAAHAARGPKLPNKEAKGQRGSQEEGPAAAATAAATARSNHEQQLPAASSVGPRQHPPGAAATGHQSKPHNSSSRAGPLICSGSRLFSTNTTAATATVYSTTPDQVNEEAEG